MTTRNAIVGQSGGPTAVINQSLVGLIEGLRETLARTGEVSRVLAMRHGVRGLTQDQIIDMSDLGQARLDRLADTPSAALGSTRDKPDAAYGARILDACRKHDIRYFFYIGGNDSSDTCRIVREAAVGAGYDLRCFHIPKTVDNDLLKNDHTPGYPSAARFVATAFLADNLDNRSIPGIKINIIMGRHAGFLTAASALARQTDDDGPHLVYVPEVPFDTDRFVADVEAVNRRLGRCHVAVSEGIENAEGKAIGATLAKNVERDAHGNVQLSGSGALGDLLADLIRTRLTTPGGKPPRVRADTFGYLQRCWPDPSPVDRSEAREAGRYAAHLAAQGLAEGSIAIERTSGKGEPYASEMTRVELSDVAGKTRLMPAEYLAGHNNVTRAFMDYARPLIGELPEIERL